MNLAHIILTRSAYRDRDRDYLHRRLELMQRITIPSLQSQTVQKFRWVVRLCVDDESLDWRKSIVDSCGGVGFYSGTWREAIEHQLRGDETHLLTTRLDDDDALSVDMVERLQATASRYLIHHECALYAPQGYVWRGESLTPKEHRRNQFVSLLVPVNSHQSVTDRKHAEWRVEADCVVDLDARPGWLWTRHRDAKTNKRDNGALSARNVHRTVKERFGIDWDAF